MKHRLTHEPIPPTEDFFSQQWYEEDGFPMTMLKNDLLSRIDSTRRKLSELESKLFQRLDNNRYRLRVGWLRGYIGIWTTDSDEWGVKMIYPHTKQVMSVNWPQTLFGERKEGNVLILLSSSSITWLNAVDKWVSGVASSTTVSST